MHPNSKEKILTQSGDPNRTRVFDEFGTVFNCFGYDNGTAVVASVLVS